MTGSLASTGAAAHVLVDDVEALDLGSEARHHLERVLRLRPGTEVTIGDGQGSWRAVSFGPRLEPIGPVVFVPPTTRPITIACALAKADKPELVTQKLTEIGVDEIVFFPAQRSVVRWDAERVSRNLERLQRVANAAVEQARRPWSPSVKYTGSVQDLLTRPDVVCADLGGAEPTIDHRVVLIGPEGGWDERDGVNSSISVGFGPNVLRSETAAITAGAVLCSLRMFKG